ncbi:MAG: hypothetical protein ACJAVM_001058 [Sulfitobacter sp.]|jgi:hypothetical protein
MTRTLALFVIGIVFGGGLGFAIAAGNGITFDGHDHGDPAAHGGPAMDHTAMGHETADHEMNHDTPVDLPATDAPEVTMVLTPDPMAGYNLHILTRNFAFAPEQASLAHVAGQGHAHVYINGEKLGRVYGPWLHIARLPKGEVTLVVTLNSNDHRPLAVDGNVISASTTLTVD